MFEYKLVFTLFLISPSLVFANDPGAILHEADAFRLPDGPVRVETKVRHYRKDKTDKERHYTVYIKPPRRSLVLMKSPMEVGQKVLMLGEKFWLLTAESQRPLRITSSQKLLGEASTGDIANMTWSGDYIAQESTEVECPQFLAALSGIEKDVFKKPSSCLRLRLTANAEGLTYSHITLYVDKNSKMPIKADLFVNSGKKAKEAWYVKLENNDKKYIDTMILIDNIQSTRHTIVTYENIDSKACPDEFFNPAALVRNALPGW
jgi:hypothetical protein